MFLKFKTNDSFNKSQLIIHQISTLNNEIMNPYKKYTTFSYSF